MSEARDEAWTVRRMLRWMADDFQRLGIATARLDAELLIAQVLGVKRVQLYLDMERPLSQEELTEIRAYVKRRRQYEPVAYMQGQREFYGRSFLVDSRVLVPRPDTERLVDEALARLPASQEGLRILDLCTGSGCIGLTLLAERPLLQGDLTDVSPLALEVAQSNAERLNVAERAQFFDGDMFAPLPAGSTYDVIACNPPYIAEAEWPTLQRDVRDHEPRLALVAEDQGFSFYRRLSQQAMPYLSSAGSLIVEVGQGQAEAVMTMCRDAGFAEVLSVRDLSGIPRVVVASKVASAIAGEVTLDVEDT